MKKTDLLIGIFIGIIVNIIGVVIISIVMSKMNFKLLDVFVRIKQEGILGKVITLGAILNVLVFFLLLKMKKELMARGVVLATILLAIVTLFI